MSLANEASLLLIPSGYKSGIVYSVFPTDGDGDFTFSRGSDGTRKGAGGLVETMSSNIPRLDYSNGDCPSLLLEPERTNEFTYSEEFNQSVWFKSNSTITTNQIIAPDGTLTADLLTSRASGGGVYKFGAWSTTEKTISIFVKKNSSNIAEIFNASSSTNRVVFDLNNGTISTQGGTMTGKIEDFANDWYRLSATHTATASQTFGLKPSPNLSLFIWGAQSESAAYSTNYIKTTSGIVTRQKDICINGGDADLFNITEGTLFVNVTPYIYPSANTYISLNDGGSSDRFVFIFQTYGTAVRLFGVSSGSNFLSNYQDITFNQKNKIAITFKQNEFKIYVNGLLKYTDTSGNVPIGLNQLDFTEHNGNRNFQGKVHDTRVYDRVLTQAEAIALTTL